MEIVSFEIAKKLKEKGFPQGVQHCIGWYPTEYYKNSCIGEYFEGELQEIEDYFGDRISAIHIMENEKKGVIAPTISQVLKWLREMKKVHLIVEISDSGWYYTLYPNIRWENGKLKSDKYFMSFKHNPSYELAALAGIEYCLDNLI